MPTKLNGTYWTVPEIAEALGREYSGVNRRIQRRSGLIRVGSIILVPDAIAKSFINQINTTTVVPATAAVKLGMSIDNVQKIIDAGFPTVEDFEGRTAFQAAHIDILRVAYMRILRSGNHNKYDRFKATAELAMKLLAKVEKKQKEEGENEQSS